MLSDPFLQLPTKDTVTVVWFTEWAGSQHYVTYGTNLEHSCVATTKKMTRLREDQKSHRDQVYNAPTPRNIWRHEALVSGLTSGVRLPYQAFSFNQNQKYQSRVFTLAPKPEPGTPLKILLTSDHQLMPLTAANLQKVRETLGQIDGIFLAGDLVNISDRASEWFDDTRGGAFFPCLQGRGNYALTKNNQTTVYHGGELIQHTPLFTALGNHEVMGSYAENKDLNQQFSDAKPRNFALNHYESLAHSINPENDPVIKQAWLLANSFNTDTYEEIFTLPQSIPGGKKYYSLTFGDIWLGVLYVTNIWRSPLLDPNIRGRYQESTDSLNDPQQWGYGQHIFEPITPESDQYIWLKTQLTTPEFQQAKYKIIMFHHPPHTLGGNIVPPYTNPIPKIEYDSLGKIKSINYEYPPEQDYIIRHLIPLLEEAKIQLVFFGHSHLWNRFTSDLGMHFLESSNVGNSYGGHVGANHRPIPENSPYAATGDPNGLEPIIPNIAPLTDPTGQPLAYIASNDITVFSILDTGVGSVSSYRFDTREPNTPAIKFDEFRLI